jgi:hypothetical protein
MKRNMHASYAAAGFKDTLLRWMDRPYARARNAEQVKLLKELVDLNLPVQDDLFLARLITEHVAEAL